jgi:hypothetical protein
MDYKEGGVHTQTSTLRLQTQSSDSDPTLSVCLSVCLWSEATSVSLSEGGCVRSEATHLSPPYSLSLLYPYL